MEVTAKIFQSEVIEADQRWSNSGPWCQPEEMAPAMEEVARNKADMAKFVRIRIDNNQSLADQYKVDAIHPSSSCSTREKRLNAVMAKTANQIGELIEEAMQTSP
ncbi:MAG: thioredoxin family protein [Planctomycetaceae bacterium]